MTTCSYDSKSRVVLGLMWPFLGQDINLVPKSWQTAKRVGSQIYPCLQHVMLEFRAEGNTGVQRIFGCDGRCASLGLAMYFECPPDAPSSGGLLKAALNQIESASSLALCLQQSLVPSYSTVNQRQAAGVQVLKKK